MVLIDETSCEMDLIETLHLLILRLTNQAHRNGDRLDLELIGNRDRSDQSLSQLSEICQFH